MPMERFHPPSIMVAAIKRVLTALVGCRTTKASLNMVARGGHRMAWTTPTLVEICIGLEINGYLPAEF